MKQVKFDFTGCNFAVTGASSGMGRQIALDLASAGATVLAIARRKEELQEVAELYPEKIVTAAIDVCNREAMETAVHGFVESHGKLNGSVHAAGVVGFTPLQSYDRKLAHDIMEISFWAGMDFLQLASKKRYGAQGASHLLFSSISAISSDKGKFAYNAAKAALNNAVRTTAQELCRHGQRVNCLMPGWVRSPMTERFAPDSDLDSFLSHQLLGEGNPEDVAGMALFLLSDSAAWITGTAFAVDGGFLAGY